MGKKQLLKKESIALLRKPHVSAGIMPGPERWGLGVRVILDESYKDLHVGSYGWSGLMVHTFEWIQKTRCLQYFLKIQELMVA